MTVPTPAGSSIDFAALGELHLVRPAAVRRARPVLGVRSRSGERALQLPVSFALGDVVAWVDDRMDPWLVGPPMQVIGEDDAGAVVLLDRRFGHHLRVPRRVLFPLLDGGAELTRAVLRMWGVDRCPHCAAPGHATAAAGNRHGTGMHCVHCLAQWRSPWRTAA